MLKKTGSFVLGSSEFSTYPEGTTPVSTRLRPCWRPFWASWMRLSCWACARSVPHPVVNRKWSRALHDGETGVHARRRALRLFRKFSVY